MTESIRLVIWDLDDTFWKGTLSEGPIDYVADHGDVVAELARRGIISSICSKNDFEPVKELLEERGAWASFVFPSINWEAKGPRIKALIDTIQLRPQSVLLIDDNPMNRSEAEHFAPGIQTADETLIGALLNDERCRGKPDPELKRLAQYKLLEHRKADEASAVAAGSSNHDFLRESDIRIAIEYDVKAQLDRAIELINRTNQLNFTKQRLSENLPEAREELLALISKPDMIAGIVRVVDRYGDYGDAGFFALKRTATTNRLVHFCFSCRTLNMGVENWVYQFLERPALRVVGETVSDVRNDTVAVDWITQVDRESLHGANQTGARELAEVHLSGSCDLRPLEHYFAEIADHVLSELTTFRDGFCLRPDHSVLLRYSAQFTDPEFIEDCRPLGYLPEDFEKDFLDGEGQRIYVLSFMADFNCGIYRHIKTGQLIPLRLGGGNDLLTMKMEDISSDRERTKVVVAQLAEKFEYVGRTPSDLFESNVKTIVEHVDPEMPVYLLLPNERKLSGEPIKSRVVRNKILRKIARRYPNVFTASLEAFTETNEERLDLNHFDRMVYHRFYKAIVDHQRGWLGDPSSDEQAPRLEATDDDLVPAGVR